MPQECPFPGTHRPYEPCAGFEFWGRAFRGRAARIPSERIDPAARIASTLMSASTARRQCALRRYPPAEMAAAPSKGWLSQPGRRVHAATIGDPGQSSAQPWPSPTHRRKRGRRPTLPQRTFAGRAPFSPSSVTMTVARRPRRRPLAVSSGQSTQGVTSTSAVIEKAVPSEPVRVKLKAPRSWKPGLGWKCALCLSAAGDTAPFSAPPSV